MSAAATDMSSESTKQVAIGTVTGRVCQRQRLL